jgi:alkylation response protein AidB-like acyl-CoA dehydrogenase
MTSSNTRSDDGLVLPEDLVARARSFIPTLHAAQEHVEEARQVPQEIIDRLLEADLFRVVQPKRYGGFEYGFDVFARVVMEISAGCGSTGWVYSVLAQHQWLIGLFPVEAQDDVWSKSRLSIAASSYRPSGIAIEENGGYRVSGLWSFCSGCDNAQWMIFGVAIASKKGEPPTDQGWVIVPRAEVEFEDNWNVIGLAGTGSKNAVVEETFVPAHRVLKMGEATTGQGPGARVNRATLYRIPIFSAVSICLAAPALGIASGVLDDYIESTRQRSTVGGIHKLPKKMAELPGIQLRLAEAACAIDAARVVFLRDCQEVLASVENGGLSLKQRVRNKADMSYAVTLATGAVDKLFKSTGGHGLDRNNRIQRAWRDINGAAAHISLNWDSSGTNYGRVLLDLPPEGAQF